MFLLKGQWKGDGWDDGTMKWYSDDDGTARSGKNWGNGCAQHVCCSFPLPMVQTINLTEGMDGIEGGDGEGRKGK